MRLCVLMCCLQVEKIYVVKMGEIALTTPDGRTVTDPAFVKEAGGFTFFGDGCLEAISRCPYTVSSTAGLAAFPNPLGSALLAGREL